MFRRGWIALWLIVGIAVAAAAAPLAAQTYPPRPGQRDFILDQANLLKPEDATAIRAACDKLLRETRIPIIVVTIPSLAKYGGTDIETYARGLFDNWGIGAQAKNYGVLLLVSVGDRKARIELGGAWAGAKDSTARMIMNDIIIPNFKQGDYSAGILQGVQGLEAMVRGEQVANPRQKRDFWIFVAVMAGLIFLGVSLIRSGRKGWGWAVLVVAGTILVTVLFMALRGGGKSFGGGSGGGGGATGSW